MRFVLRCDGVGGVFLEFGGANPAFKAFVGAVGEPHTGAVHLVSFFDGTGELFALDEDQRRVAGDGHDQAALFGRQKFSRGPDCGAPGFAGGKLHVLVSGVVLGEEILGELEIDSVGEDIAIGIEHHGIASGEAVSLAQMSAVDGPGEDSSGCEHEQQTQPGG